MSNVSVPQPTIAAVETTSSATDHEAADALGNVSAIEAAALPTALQWALVGWYRATNRIDRAADLLDAIETTQGDSVRLLEERARLAHARGSLDEAEQLLRQREERSPSATATIARARLALDRGQIDQARQLSQVLWRDRPDLMTVAALAADVAEATGDIASARRHHEAILAERPGHVGTLLALARLSLAEAGGATAEALVVEAMESAASRVTSTQLGVAATIAEATGRADLASTWRTQATAMNQERTITLAADIRAALAGVTSGQRHSAPSAPARSGFKNGSRPSSGDERAVTIARQPVNDTAERPSFPSLSTLEPVWTAGPDAGVTIPVDARVLTTLQTDFGHVSLRPGQAAVIANVLAGRDTLAIMPTGAGKSLTFQLPAMTMDGLTLVISPLIALMHDQVEGLSPAVRARTALLNSSLSTEEQRRVLDRVEAGTYRLLYIAPERLRHQSFLHALRRAKVSLVVVDEAHCISMWGHDFRPDYLSIPVALPEFGSPPVLAMTATATPAMAKQIGKGLARELDLVRTSVFRPNLTLEAERVATREEKARRVVEICRQEHGSGIVYVSSRKDAEQIAGVLRDRGVAAIPYHAGLAPDIRTRNQERFMGGHVRVVVATVAFGMGVDKKDVRFIVHLSPPRSLEAYAQESGRAGRDGAPARCVLLTTARDQQSLRQLARRDEVEIDTIRRVYAGVKRAASGRWATLDPATLVTGDGDDDAPDPRVALGLLERADLLRRHPDAPVTLTIRRVPRQAAAEIAADPAVARLLSWIDREESSMGESTIVTRDACAALDLTPAELTSLLAEQPGLEYREGKRAVCLELLPAGDDPARRLTQIMERARHVAELRIAQVFAYATDHRCRHQALAQHLGEALDPCRTVCDVCRSQGAGSASSQSRRPPAAEAPPRRTHTVAADARAVIDAVRTLPFPMGKTGLTKLLSGSVESRVQADRSPSFGALAGLTKGKVDALIDRLIEDGLLSRDLDHEFKLIGLTERGRSVSESDLAAYDDVPRRPPSVRSGADAGDARDRDDLDLDADGVEVLERLKAWRTDRASRDAVPPYVVAHNSMLVDLALVRPTTAERLERVKGFGPSRVERYGEEVLAVIAGA